MKVSRLIIAIAMLLLPLMAESQSLDCSDNLKYRKVKQPWKLSALSKSAVCVSGNKYEFIVPLQAGLDYRFSFMASPVFNNNIHFKIIDQSSGDIVLDLPGKLETEGDVPQGSCVLVPFLDNSSGKYIPQYFDFAPQASTSLKIIIDVKQIEQPQDLGKYAKPKTVRGCITVFILYKKAEKIGF